MFTPEQELKLEQLRIEADKDLLSVVDYIKNRKNPKKEPSKPYDYKVDDKVFVYELSPFGHRIITHKKMKKGTITGIKEDENFEKIYQITTVQKKVIEVRYENLELRIVEDLSNVEVDEFYQKMPTERLLKIYKYYRFKNHLDRHDLYQIKAELQKREHVKSKEEIQQEKDSKTIKKLKEKVKRQKENGIKDSKDIRLLKKKLKKAAK